VVVGGALVETARGEVQTLAVMIIRVKIAMDHMIIRVKMDQGNMEVMILEACLRNPSWQKKTTIWVHTMMVPIIATPMVLIIATTMVLMNIMMKDSSATTLLKESLPDGYVMATKTVPTAPMKQCVKSSPQMAEDTLTCVLLCRLLSWDLLIVVVGGALVETARGEVQTLAVMTIQVKIAMDHIIIQVKMDQGTLDTLRENLLARMIFILKENHLFHWHWQKSVARHPKRLGCSVSASESI